ncbi:efflux RND transporter periplasmic adaptor subunit [Cellvibrio sp. NN19]|uniref:efflux RND transporter periplasmic adaptor subunit n=1 Tax=Cellvibrio chitinivorans TaxID=3102792 RepID=UPI002B407C4F|nr:efflux RND transporter periplasmic adaptor subunit [Cellvibrio sp. NN19]
MSSYTASLKFWLSMQCQMLGSVNAAMLVQTPAGASPAVLAKWSNTAVNDAALRFALKQVVDKKRLYVMPDDEGFLVLGQPVQIEDEPWGVLLLHLSLKDKKELPAVLKNISLAQFWLQFLVRQSVVAVQAVGSAQTVDTVQSEASPDANPVASKVLQLSAGLLKEYSLQEAAISLVNLLATSLSAARVSLGLRRGNNVLLEAVSFSANFDRRTQSMQAVSEAMAEAIDQGVAIDYPSDVTVNSDENSASPLSGLITRAHQHLLQQQQVQSVHSLLLRNNNAILGVLIIELDKQAHLSEEQRNFLQQSLHFAGAIFALRQQATAGVWQGVKRRSLARIERWFGREGWRTKLIATSFAVLFIALFIPLEYRIAADANLQTTEKYWVVSPQEGYLDAISVRPGDTVKKGALLANLKDDDLRLERRKLASQVQQYRQTQDAALANANRVEAAIARAQMDQTSIQLQLIDQQLQRTELIAPIDGVVVSDDISQTRGAPVKQGDLLFEIAATTGYLVQLYVDERDIASVKVDQDGQVKFSSLPGEIFALRVKTITPISEVREGRNYFRVECELQRELDVLRPGMTGSGKLSAGKRALGWIWFHDLWHWLQLKLW